MMNVDVCAQRKQAFKARVRSWAERLDVNVVWLGIRPMRNKWASCSTKGCFNFNSDLLMMNGDIWDYVIVHELLHFSVPNHGPLWKMLMTLYLGDWQSAEFRLNHSVSRGDA